MSYQRRNKSKYFYYSFRCGQPVFNIYACGGRLGYALAREWAAHQEQKRLWREYRRAVKEAEKERRRHEREAGKVGQRGGR
jgi:hypothetical protein